MAHNERFEELAALHALGVPLGEEAAEFEHHLASCAICEELVSDFRAASTALAATTPPVRPRPELRTRVLDSLGPARPAFVPASAAAPVSRRSVAPWLFAAAAALLLVLAVGDDARLRREREDLRSQTEALRRQTAEDETLRREAAGLRGVAAALSERLSAAQRRLARRDLQVRVLESDDVRILFLGGKAPQPGARGKVFWSTKAGRGVLVAANLQNLTAGKQYELWAFAAGKPVPAGVFDADESGRALLESKDLSALGVPEKFAVTVEPHGGVSAPTGPIVLASAP